MGPLQILIIALTLGLNAMDGIDLLSIGLAAPDIAKQWKLSEFLTAVTTVMELVGMGIGSFALGWIADTVGRRKTMIWCLVVMATGMFMAPSSGNVYQLWAWRVFTGLGIGGLLSSITAITAEFSNLKKRALCIFIMGIGYPIGGIVGSKVAGYLLKTYENWHLIFYFGGALTLVFLLIFYFTVPESIHWLVRKQPAGALDRVNKILKRLGYKTVTALPEVTSEARKKSIGDLFAPGLLGVTVIIAVAYFLQIFTYYPILKLVPKIVVNMHFTSAEGADMLMYANLGGAIGGICLGLLTLRFSVKKLTIAVLALSGVAIIIFGQTPTDLTYFAILVAFCGVFGNAGILGLYALFPAAFPTHVRASGTGFVLSVGRLGAGLGPAFVGLMFDWGMTLPRVALLISIGTFTGACVLAFLKLVKNTD